MTKPRQPKLVYVSMTPKYRRLMKKLVKQMRPALESLSKK